MPEGDSKTVTIHQLDADENLLTTFNMRMASGDYFSKDMPSLCDGYVINETLAQTPLSVASHSPLLPLSCLCSPEPAAQEQLSWFFRLLKKRPTPNKPKRWAVWSSTALLKRQYISRTNKTFKELINKTTLGATRIF